MRGNICIGVQECNGMEWLRETLQQYFPAYRYIWGCAQFEERNDLREVKIVRPRRKMYPQPVLSIPSESVSLSTLHARLTWHRQSIVRKHQLKGTRFRTCLWINTPNPICCTTFSSFNFHTSFPENAFPFSASEISPNHLAICLVIWSLMLCSIESSWDSFPRGTAL